MLKDTQHGSVLMPPAANARVAATPAVARSLGATLRLLPIFLLASGLGAAHAAAEPSEAEVALFMSDHFKAAQTSTTLTYAFVRRGSMETGFSDTVQVTLDHAKQSSGKAIRTRCLSGPRAVKLPDVEQVEGNPALFCFLERDIREMERLTGGKANYFRKRIRMALAEQAEVRAVKFAYAGKQIEGKEVQISPYLNDPLRERFEKYAGKYYIFTLSNQIPGGIYKVDAVIPDRSQGNSAPGGSAHLVEEVLSLSKAEPLTKQ